MMAKIDKKYPNRRETSVMLKCGCGCCTFVAERTVWDGGDIDYNISVLDSRYDHYHNTIWGRIKSAFKILLGKPVYYNDVYIGEPQKFIEFVDELNDLCLDDKQHPRTVRSL
jgi:hypothetical protein